MFAACLSLRGVFVILVDTWKKARKKLAELFSTIVKHFCIQHLYVQEAQSLSGSCCATTSEGHCEGMSDRWNKNNSSQVFTFTGATT